MNFFRDPYTPFFFNCSPPKVVRGIVLRVYHMLTQWRYRDLESSAYKSTRKYKGARGPKMHARSSKSRGFENLSFSAVAGVPPTAIFCHLFQMSISSVLDEIETRFRLRCKALEVTFILCSLEKKMGR